MCGLARRLAAGFAFVLMASAGTSGTAWAKTPGYILSGGELGERALHFYTDDYIEMPGPHVVEVSPPDSWPGVPYLLYRTWPFATAAQVASSEPLAYLFPATRLVHKPASGAWLKLDESIWQGMERWSGVQKALDVARSNLDALPKGILMASLIGRGFDLAWWDVFSGTVAELGVAQTSLDIPLVVYQRGLDPRAGPDGTPARRLNPGEFPLEEFAAAIGEPPLAEAPRAGQTFAYSLNVSAPTPAGSWHAPGILYYAPPTSERGGRIWEGTTRGAGGALVWASTTEFDARFEAALRAAETRIIATAEPRAAPTAEATGRADAESGGDRWSLIAGGAVLAAVSATVFAASRRHRRSRKHGR